MVNVQQTVEQFIGGFRAEIEASQNALLSSRISDLEQHTVRLQQMILEAADVLPSTDPSASQELQELRRELRVYASVLKRASRYLQAELNAIALCSQECSYGPDSWTVSAMRTRR